MKVTCLKRFKFRAAVWLENTYADSIRENQKMKEIHYNWYYKLWNACVRHETHESMCYLQILPTAAWKPSIFGLMSINMSWRCLMIFGFNTCSDITIKRCKVFSRVVQFSSSLNTSGSVFLPASWIAILGKSLNFWCSC